jgi:hypothetical protein
MGPLTSEPHLKISYRYPPQNQGRSNCRFLILLNFKNIKNMVQISNFSVRKRLDGTTFVSLELTGSIELVQNQKGNFYATVRKCNIPSTFDESVAKMMIGQQLDGDIVRVATENYSYTNQRTGEVMQLSHSFAYRPKGSVELIGQTKVQDVQLAEQ